jgi:hypothetical protein
MKTRLLLYQVIQGGTSVAFLITGAVQLSGGVPVQWLSLELGLPVGLLQGVGLYEIVFALLKLAPRVRVAGQLGLGLIMVGALGVNALAGRPLLVFLPPLLLLGLLFASLWLHYTLFDFTEERGLDAL